MLLALLLLIGTNSTELDENSNVTVVPSTIEIPQAVFLLDEAVAYVFSSYNSPILFQVVTPKNVSDYNMTADTEVLGFTLPGNNISNLNDSMAITITLQSIRALQGKVINSNFCVHYNNNLINFSHSQSHFAYHGILMQ